MASKVSARPQARSDIIENAVYIGRDNVDAANRFLDATEATLKLLSKSPHVGGAYPTNNEQLVGLRVVRVEGFPNHLVFYRPSDDTIDIIRVIDGRRDLDLVLSEK